MSREQYDKIAEEYSQMLNPTKKYVLIPMFKRLIGNISGKTVLDLGCGDGFFTRLLFEMSPAKIVGVDISEELIKIAIERENPQPLGIEYSVGDVLKLQPKDKFDIVTTVYLLNYSKTREELFSMCNTIYSHLRTGGVFCAITVNPALKPMIEFEYERRFTNVAREKQFNDGNQIKCEIKETGKKPFEFISYYWSKEAYEGCLLKAGFNSVEWIAPIISKEGIAKFGADYWNNFMKNPSPIGIICRKV